jgi:hypothetical protein
VHIKFTKIPNKVIETFGFYSNNRFPLLPHIMHETNRMITIVQQTKLMPISYESALQQAASLLDGVAHNLRAWPASSQYIRVPAHFTFQHIGASSLRCPPQQPAKDHPLLPLVYEIARAHEALDTILNAFHFTNGGIYSLDYNPRMPEMAGHDSDPWVTAYTMQEPMDKSAFRVAFHAMLTTIELLKGPDLEAFARHADAIAGLYESALEHLTVRQEFYLREHPSSSAPPKPDDDYSFLGKTRSRKAQAAV